MAKSAGATRSCSKVEMPALELSAEDLAALASRKVERGKHGKKRKKHKKKGDSKKGGGHA